MNVVSAGALGYAAAKTKKDELSEKKLPVMAVAGAFVFAAQMINFTIPATGSSGHLGGGILLAALLGGFPAFLTLAAVLIIQCLFFADGGLLALGCNIFNIALIPCLVIYPLIFKPLTKKGFSSKSLSIATVLSVIVGLQLGALGVVVETMLSGISVLPFDKFALLMQPIHLAIGLVEGLVTTAILIFIYKMRPEIMDSTRKRTSIAPAVSMKKVTIILCAVTLIVAAGLSLFASAYPDGLEWSMENITGTTELVAEGDVHEGAAGVQSVLGFMPDYNYPNAGEGASHSGTAVAGIVGSVITFALAGTIGFGIRSFKKLKRR
jgi:cobalt/nickel transport system permease protein